MIADSAFRKSRVKQASKRALDVLSGNSTPWRRNREILLGLFSDNCPSLQLVIHRLSLLDALYSTNMRMRYFGTEEIAAAIYALGVNDTERRVLFLEYVNQRNANLVAKLISEDVNYGYRKPNVPFGSASSLISKYGYFLTNFQFPIVDSLVRKKLKILSIPHNNELPIFPNGAPPELARLSWAQQEYGVTFESLDALLWLGGKVDSNSLSLVLDKEQWSNRIESKELKEFKELWKSLK